MGLDMYLSKRTYVKNWEHQDAKDKHEVTIKGKLAASIRPERISNIVEEIAYWRKANQIHAWFVDNCQEGVDDCRDAYVPREKLQELLDICKKVRDGSKLKESKVENGYSFEDGKRVPIIEDGKVIEDPSVAEELLPPQEGFFFGGTGYDEYYLNDVLHTIEVLESELAEDSGGDYYYHSSW